MPFILEFVKKEIAHLNEQIEVIDTRILQHVGKHQELKEDRGLLASISEIGDSTAASRLDHLGGLSRCRGCHKVQPDPEGPLPETAGSGKTEKVSHHHLHEQVGPYHRGLSGKAGNPLMPVAHCLFGNLVDLIVQRLELDAKSHLFKKTRIPIFENVNLFL